MTASWVCVDASQNVIVRVVEYARNSPLCERMMHEYLSLLVDHRETSDLVDRSNCLISSSDTTERWFLNQQRPVLDHGSTPAFMSMSKCQWPSLLSQTRTEEKVAVAIRSPSGEYFTALSEFECPSVCTFLPSARSQTMAVLLTIAATSRVESGEKSTPRTVSSFSLNVQTFSYVFESHTCSSPPYVPAAVQLPSLDTARQ